MNLTRSVSRLWPTDRTSLISRRSITIKIAQGDCLEVLGALSENAIAGYKVSFTRFVVFDILFLLKTSYSLFEKF